MNLLDAVAANLPDGYTEAPTVWDRTFATAAEARLAETHPIIRRLKQGEDAKITQAGLDAALTPTNCTQFLDGLKAMGEGLIAQADAMPEGTPVELATKNATRLQGRTLVRQWAMVTGDGEGQKGFYEYSDPQTQAGFDQMQSLLGLLTTSQRTAIHEFWTEPMARWEVAGLSKAPTKRDIAWAYRDAGLWQPPAQGGDS